VSNKLKAVRNHVWRNKSGYVMGIAFVGAMALVVRNNKGMEAFLIEKGINPVEFFNPEELVV
jgi:hypothetical protein